MPAPVEPPANFAFLAKVHARLHSYAIRAERLCLEDPGACLARLRKLAEWVACTLALELVGDRIGDLVVALERLKGVRGVEREMLVPLEWLRRHGNDVLHRHDVEPRVEGAIEGLQMAWRLCKAYARRVGLGEGLPGVFIPPVDRRVDPRVVRETQARLVEIEEENVQLRAELARRPEPMPVEALAGQLRELAARARTPLPFAGLAHHGRGAQVTIEEIYVHRSFTAGDGATIDHEALLTSFDATPAPRRVILGAARRGQDDTVPPDRRGARAARAGRAIRAAAGARGRRRGARHAARRGGAVDLRADLAGGRRRGRGAAARRGLGGRAVRRVRRDHQPRRACADGGVAAGVHAALPRGAGGRHQ